MGTRIRALAILVAFAAAPAMFAEDADRAWLGIVVAGDPGGGARLLAVVPGGPAERAGLRKGDVLLELDGRPWSEESAAAGWVAPIRPGQQVRYRIARSGVERVGTLIAGSRAERARPFAVAPSVGAPMSAARVRPGFVPVAIPETVRRSLGAPEDRGVLLGAVEPRSPAERAGFRTGDVVTRFGDHPVRTPTEVYTVLRAVRGDDPMDVEIVRDGVGRTLQLRYAPGPPEAPAPPAPGHAADRARMLRDEIEFLRRRLERLERELEALAPED